MRPTATPPLRSAGEDGCPPPRNPLLPHATMGGVWNAAPGDGRSESGLQLHLLSESRVRTDVLPRGTPPSPLRPWAGPGLRGLGAAAGDPAHTCTSPPPCARGRRPI